MLMAWGGFHQEQLGGTRKQLGVLKDQLAQSQEQLAQSQAEVSSLQAEAKNQAEKNAAASCIQRRFRDAQVCTIMSHHAFVPR